MPGHAGNFLERLFSLSHETVPHFPLVTLRTMQHDECDISLNSRFNSYKFSNVANLYNSWQQFHRACPDFSNDTLMRTFAEDSGNTYSTVIYGIHPHEFSNYSDKIAAIRDTEIYWVELDAQYDEWVADAGVLLEYTVRDGEREIMRNIASEFPANFVNLSTMLISDLEFATEYNRLISLMGLTPCAEVATIFYNDWKSVRMPVDTRRYHIISKPHHDDHTCAIYKDLLDNSDNNFFGYYLWSTPPTKLTQFLDTVIIRHDNIILGVKDTLDLWADYDYWRDSAHGGTHAISYMMNAHPNTNFILFTSYENLETELGATPNVQIIPWGGDMVNQSLGYPTIVPVLTKNFESDKTFISLNRNTRLHRIVLLSYLFGKKYDKFGDISFLGSVTKDKFATAELLDRLSWVFEDRHNDAKRAMILGYKKVYDNPDLMPEEFGIYGATPNDNVANFNNNLRDRYQNVFVEIITETTFAGPSFMLTEKTLNSVYGCNFPILLSGVNAVSHLRELGFDVFDDIIDHSYDTIKNPIDRMVSAIENNNRLLTDGEYVKEKWIQSKDRFEKNVEVAKTIYSWYEARTRQKFSEITWK